MLLNFDTLPISLSQKEVFGLLNKKEPSSCQNFRRGTWFEKKRNQDISGFIFVTVLSENSFFIEKKVELNYKGNFFISFPSFMRSLHYKSLSDFDYFPHCCRMFSFGCCLFHFLIRAL